MQLAVFLRSSSFPPEGPLPPVDGADVPLLLRTAQGSPGQVVWPGLFPRPPAKLARLLLASLGLVDSHRLRSLVAADITARGPGPVRGYHALDALACALVHPSFDQAERLALVVAALPTSPGPVGHRARKKRWAVARWAVEQGFVDRTSLPPLIAQCLAAPLPVARGELAFDPAPGGSDGALACLSAAWPRFSRTLARERAASSWLDYPGIADAGHRHFRAFACGCRDRWVERVFDAIEHVLAHGDGAAQNLVVVGLFEAVQNDAYRQCPEGDRYEARLGPSSRRAWADLIEGWTGAGIRDLAAWRKKAEAP